MKKIIIVLDSFDYKNNKEKLLDSISDLCEPIFFYTKYENTIIQLFQKAPYIGGLLTHVTYWILSAIYALKLLLMSKRIDTVVFINPIVGFFYSLIINALPCNVKIHISGFLFEPKSNKIYYFLRKKLVLIAYRKVTNIIVYGNEEIHYYSNIFPSLADKFLYVQYGRDYDSISNINFLSDRPYVASGGRSNRDYSTFFQAMSNVIQKDKGLYSIVATRPECITSGMNIPLNVRVKYGITLNQFGAFLEKSLFVVLPLKDIGLSAGHMALFEAMYHKKIIIVTDIPSIRNYVDDRHVLFYDPNDSEDLANKILYVASNIDSDVLKNLKNDAYTYYQDHYSFKAMLYRIIKQISV